MIHPFAVRRACLGPRVSRGVVIAWALALVAASSTLAERPTDPAKSANPNAPLTMADLKALEGQIQAVVRRVAPAVVSVAGGSGVVVSEDGYVLTVAHLGEQAGRTVTIRFPDGRKVQAKTLGNDHGVDAALVKIVDAGPWPYVPMGKSKDLKPGQWCLTLGYPISFERGKPPIVRLGRVQKNHHVMIVTDCTIMGGDSGGPLLDLEGNIIGIGSRCDEDLTTNLHVPIDRFHRTWDRLVKGEDFDSLHRSVAFLGVVIERSAGDTRIDRVLPGSGAQKAGIQPGDLLLTFDGAELQRYSDLLRMLGIRKPGDQVEIEVRRGEEIVKVQAVLSRSHPR